MATVYLAQDLKHERPVALKVLRPALAMSMGPDRFRREITTAARLQHPHILSVHDSGETDGLLWYTMPYVRGESLRDRLKRDGRLPLDETLRITSEAGRALDYAHREGVIHRDIKPENILLTLDGDTLVADFGIARALGGPSENRLTQAGLALGTPAYMAPEQATGERGVDARTDQYSLAVVCYEMLTGRPPFEGSTGAAVLAKRFTSAMPAVRSLRPEVPEAAERALQRAMALDPAQRFGSVAEFVRALGAAAASTPVAGVPAIPDSLAPTAATPAPPRAARRAPPLAARRRAGARGGAGHRRRSRSAARAARPAPTLRRDTRLAVLPFESLGDSANAYFADGMADAVRGKLTELDRLQVIARSQLDASIAAAPSRRRRSASELGVRYLLIGTVRWARAAGRDQRVQVSPELVDVRAGAAPTSRWQESFDAPMTDVFKVQSDIAGKVARRSTWRSAPGSRTRWARARPRTSPPTTPTSRAKRSARVAPISAPRGAARRATSRPSSRTRRSRSRGHGWPVVRSTLYAYGTPDPAVGAGGHGRARPRAELAPAARRPRPPSTMCSCDARPTRRRRSRRWSRR